MRPRSNRFSWSHDRPCELRRFFTRAEACDGSRLIVENLKAYIETGKVTFQARMILGMYSLLSSMIPKTMRAENWPLDKAE